MTAAIIHGLERAAHLLASQLVGLCVQALVSWAGGGERRPVDRPPALWYACRHDICSFTHTAGGGAVAKKCKKCGKPGAACKCK